MQDTGFVHSTFEKELCVFKTPKLYRRGSQLIVAEDSPSNRRFLTYSKWEGLSSSASSPWCNAFPPACPASHTPACAGTGKP